jgi:FG-GAP-like repeat
MTFRFQTIDNPNAPGGQGNGTQLLAINNAGVLAGDYSDNIGNFNFGFSGVGGNFTTLAGLVFADGVDAAGDVVGYLHQGATPFGFLYNGSFNLYSDPLGTVGTAIFGVSNNGQYLAGDYYGAGTADGFVYHAGTYTTIDPAGALQTIARGVNDSGQAVGYYIGGGHIHSFLYDSGTFTQLDDPLANTSNGTQAYGINNLGQIVGVYFVSTNPGVAHGFVYSGGVFTTVDDPNAGSAGGQGTFATGINDSGQIVGYYYDSAGVSHGFVTTSQGVARNDFTGDGDSDLLWRNSNGSGVVTEWAMNSSTISSLTNVTYLGATVAPDSSWSVAGVCDFNGDGKTDVLWRQASTGAVVAWQMNGATIASSNYVSYLGSTVAPDSSWSVAGTLDTNGGGQGGVLWRQASTGALVLWQMNGATIGSSTNVTSGGVAVKPDASWSVAGIGDLNGDGNSDVIWRNSNTGEVTAWFMNGSTVTASADLTSAGASVRPDASWSIAGVGDFNGDGNADILWRNSNDHSVVEWLMNGSTIIGGGNVTSGGSAVAPDASWFVVEVGDFNGDGRSDILWRHNSDGVYGQTSAWTMNGTNIVSSNAPALSNGTVVTYPLTAPLLSAPTDFA